MSWLSKLSHQARRAMFRQSAPPPRRCPTGKRSFATKREARQALAVWRENGVGVRRHYKCKQCGSYHLTSQPYRPNLQRAAQALACALVLALPAGLGPQAQQLGTVGKPTFIVIDAEGRDSFACGFDWTGRFDGGYVLDMAPCEVLFRSGFEVQP